jgi:AcrR family transcriptional regulator
VGAGPPCPAIERAAAAKPCRRLPGTSTARAPRALSVQAFGKARHPAADGGSAAPHQRVLDPRHVRIIEAFVEVAAEHGLAGATEARVCARARVPRHTFQAYFDAPEDCLGEILDQGRRAAVEIITKAFDREEDPRDGLRAAVASLLLFLDEEPALAKVLLVESLAAGQRTLQHRERILAELRALILARLPAKDSPIPPPPYAAQAAASAALALLHARTVEGMPAPFIEMLGPVLGIIAFARLQAPAVKREIEYGNQLARKIAAGDPRWAPVRPRRPGADDAMPAMLARTARRPRECLCFLADNPGSSSRETADGIGVALRNPTHPSTEADIL